MNLLVFTGLDATLIDHDSCSGGASRVGLERIHRRQIPLIFTTSKTRFEIEQLQMAMQIREPFIAETGAAIFFPDGYRNFRFDMGFRHPPYTVIQRGATYGEIRRFFYAVKERFDLKGFGDLTIDEVARLTGLSQEQAAMAKLREFTEPFLIEDETKIQQLASIAAARGFKVIAGARFFHLIGIRQEQGHTVRLCAQIFDKNTDGKILTVGLGDGTNDASMLKSVDIPVLLPHDDGSYAELDLSNLIKAERPGRRGWNEAILYVLNRCQG